MPTPRSLIQIAIILTLFFPALAGAQYMYLDSNGDGVNNTSDVLHASGSTTVDLYLITNRNRDGSIAGCSDGSGDPSTLTVGGFDITLHAADGTVDYGDPTGYPASWTLAALIRGNTDFFISCIAPSSQSLPAGGPVRLASFVVTATCGTPSLRVVETSSFGGYYGTHTTTGFLSDCFGSAFNNFIQLGVDWYDVDGLPTDGGPPPPSPPGTDPRARSLIAPTGFSVNDWFGYTVATAGDMNGDGYGDIVIGTAKNAPGGDGSEYFGQRVHIYAGGPALDSIPDLTIVAQLEEGNFGEFVASAGDLNADGYDDIVVRSGGTCDCSPSGGPSSPHRALIYYGGAALDGTPDRILSVPGYPYEQLTTPVTGINDFNGDGFGDLAVGGSRGSPAKLYFGGPTNWDSPSLSLERPAGPHPEWDFGVTSVAGAGDVNGDGFQDVLVGESYQDYLGDEQRGRVYVYFGGVSVDGAADLTLTGNMLGDHFGAAIGSAGDVNGDGFDDVVVGAKRECAGAWGAGRVYVYFGGVAMDSNPDVILASGVPGEAFGLSVASAGDLNADGFSDIVVGAAFGGVLGGNAGRLYIFYGGSAPDDIPDHIVQGQARGDWLGMTAATAGDMNGDGVDEVVVGAYGNSDAGYRAGRVYILGFRPHTLTADLRVTPEVINLGSRAPWVTAYIESEAFSPADVDLTTVRLSGTVEADPKLAVLGDYDADDRPDLMLKFGRPAIDSALKLGVNHLELTGRLTSGTSFAGGCDVRVIDPGRSSATAAVVPNPLNPSGILRLRTIAAGPVSVRMFDARGRLVRILFASANLEAGLHEVPIDGRGPDDAALASGVYFYRIEAGNKSLIGKFVVLK